MKSLKKLQQFKKQANKTLTTLMMGNSKSPTTGGRNAKV